MEKVNSKLTWVIILLLAIAGISSYSFIPKIIDNNAGAGITLDKYVLDGYTATTSPKYLTAGAATSTSLIMSVSNAKHIDLNLAMVSSTTASVLYWKVYFSSDDSKKNWYPEGGYTATSNILRTEGASGLTHIWTPNDATASTTYKNIGIEPVASKYMKVEFSVGGTNAGLYVEGITQNDSN